MTDYQLVEAVLRGDKNQYATIMNRYHNELFTYVFNIVNHYQTTEDVVQDIFIKIYKNLKKYDKDKAGFRTWMYRVAHNYVMSYVRKNSYKLEQASDFDGYEQQSSEDIEQDMVKNEQINQVITAMKEVLSKKHLDIMYLHYFSNLTVKEISENMSIPEKTIYKAIKTSIEKIKKEVT